MARGWNEIDWGMGPPSLDDLIESWRHLRWESLEMEMPALDRFLDALDATLINGGHLIGRWKAVEYSEVTQWFVSRNRLDYDELFRTLFVSTSFHERLPELEAPVDLGRVPAGLEEQMSGSLMLDGAWAGLLVSGGAHRRFEGSAREAKALASAATEAIIGDRFEDFRVDVSHEAWTPWFADVAWDCTYVLTDLRNAEITVLCTTDTD